MFFDSIEEIPRIALKTGAAVFVVPDGTQIILKDAIWLTPVKTLITIEQIRELIQRLSVKQTKDMFVAVRPADAMAPEAANAFLKVLEEPGEKVHFVLMTNALSSLLLTILSRCEIYYLRQKVDFDAPIEADEEIKKVARQLLAVKAQDLPMIADKIAKKKERNYALNVLGVAIEMLYKTYLINRKAVFLKKIPKFLDAYNAISKNGHIKLHLVADLC